MKHIANTSRGRLSKNQQDLLHIAMNTSQFQEEMMEHPMCEVGFSKYGEDGIERMDDVTFAQAVTSLFKSRPSAHLWDVVPDIPHRTDHVLVESPEAFRMTFAEKAEFLKDEYLRRPNMVGFKFELHNVISKTDQKVGAPSVSFTIYESLDELEDTTVPVSIRVRYRARF